MNALAIARFTVHEAVRRRLILAGALVSLVFIGLYALGFSFMYSRVNTDAGSRVALVTMSAAMTMLGLYAVSFLSGFLSLFLTVGAISGEIDGGTLQALMARPVRRAEYVIGRWLGFAGIIGLYVALMASALLAVAGAIAGYEAPLPVHAIALMVLSAVALLSLSLLGSSVLSTLANGVLVFSLFGLGWLAGIIEFIGGVMSNPSMVNLGIGVSLIVPSDALWRGASYYIQSPTALLAFSSAMNSLPFASTTAPTPAMVGWSLVHVCVTLAGAVWCFSRRDL